MTTGATAPPRVPTPRITKAPPTLNLSTGSVATSNTSTLPTSATTAPIHASSGNTPVSRAGTPVARATSQPGARRAPRAATTDPLSDRATASLICRILCPEQQLEKGRDVPRPIDELLPPLTSRNDVDLQLYALIAIILREYVQKWYNKITPDESFVAETVQIIAHCTRALEQRLRKVDLESLLFDEIPDLVDRHVYTFRAAHSHVAQPPVRTEPREIYHSMWPLPALSPVPNPDAPFTTLEQAENEAAYRQLLVQGVLALLLPTEDLENDCLTALVGQIFSELIIGNVVANRVAEPWLIWECLIILSTVIRRRGGDPSAQSSIETTINIGPTSARKSFSIHGLFLTLVQWCFLAATFIRVAVTTAISSRSIPRRIRYGNYADKVTRQKTGSHGTDGASLLHTPPEPVKVPAVAFRLWSAVSNLIEMDLRMPWLRGTLSFLQWISMTGPGRVADVDGVVDRYLSSLIQQHFLDATTLPPLLRSIRGVLFPNNAPGQSTLVPPSNDGELLALRRRCASSVWALVPTALGNVYFGGRLRRWPWGGQYQRSVGDRGAGRGRVARTTAGQKDAPVPPAPVQSRPTTLTDGERSLPRSGPWGASSSDSADAPVDEEEERILSEIETGILDVFGDAYCNKHLVYGIVELVLVRLMPELTERGIIELLDERLS